MDEKKTIQLMINSETKRDSDKEMVLEELWFVFVNQITIRKLQTRKSFNRSILDSLKSSISHDRIDPKNQNKYVWTMN